MDGLEGRHSSPRGKAQRFGAEADVATHRGGGGATPRAGGVGGPRPRFATVSNPWADGEPSLTQALPTLQLNHLHSVEELYV